MSRKLSLGQLQDIRHFAATRAARTRRINEMVRRIKEARRTHLPRSRVDWDLYRDGGAYEVMFLDAVREILEDMP
jgi:hypothetical protein